jgi:hypothetical protein
MNIDGREFVLAEVSRGMGQIGVYRHISTPHSATDIFFFEQEPILKMYSKRVADELRNKEIVQLSGSDKCADYIQTRIVSCIDNYYQYSQGLVRSAIPLLEMLVPGLYVVHEAQMQPSDGAGLYFWNSYGVQREVGGTASKNANIGDKNYTPCYLLPTKQAAGFQAKKMYQLSDKLKSGERLGGIAYHITGMFSALLEGHHAATASLINDMDFRCLVIEPLTGIIFDNPGKNVQSRQVIALSSPFINIPVEQLPENTLERFLMTRRHTKPSASKEIKNKLVKTIRTVSKKAFPASVYEKAELLPEYSIVESASSVNALSDEQIAALLAGKVKVEVGEDEPDPGYIVVANYYASVVAAVDFLQLDNQNRLIMFAISALVNKDISSVHKYIAEKLLTIMHPIVYEFFKGLAADSDPKEDIVAEIAHKYVISWQQYEERKTNVEQNFHLQRKKKSSDMKAIAEAKGIASLEAAVRDIGALPKGVTY